MQGTGAGRQRGCLQMAADVAEAVDGAAAARVSDGCGRCSRCGGGGCGECGGNCC